jgi:hypothetical protein
MRQIGPTLSQILIPIWGIIVIHYFRMVALANTDTLANTEIRLPIPFFYSVPL